MSRFCDVHNCEEPTVARVGDEELCKWHLKQQFPDVWGELFNDEPCEKSLEVSNDGSHNSFYDFPEYVSNIDDLSEYLGLDGFEFNILKSLTHRIGKRHEATDEMREAKKCVHYADRRLKKLERVKG